MNDGIPRAEHFAVGDYVEVRLWGAASGWVAGKVLSVGTSSYGVRLYLDRVDYCNGGGPVVVSKDNAIVDTAVSSDDVRAPR